MRRFRSAYRSRYAKLRSRSKFHVLRNCLFAGNATAFKAPARDLHSRSPFLLTARFVLSRFKRFSISAMAIPCSALQPPATVVSPRSTAHALTCINHGSQEPPKEFPDCSGRTADPKSGTFLGSGIMDYLSRDDADGQV